MKKTFYLLMMVSALSGCQTADVLDQQERMDVQFLFPEITEQYATRATMSSLGLTDLWITDGDALVCHKKSTEADFAAPTVTLTYGSHSLCFIASKADGQSYTDMWRCSKVKDTFGKTLTVVVDGSTAGSRNVSLSRRMAKVCFAIEDAVPTTVKTMHLTADSNLALTADLTGDDACIYETTVDVTQYQRSASFNPTINVLTASPSSEEDCDVMIEFLSASCDVLYHYERTIKVKANRCTTLRGSYFSDGENSITVDNAWLDELDTPLFAE